MLKIFGRHSYILVSMVIVFVLGFSTVLYSWLRTDINDKKNQLEILTQQLDQVNKENEEIKYLISEADELELYEHLARERGYVYPDEKIYYNVTPGN